MLWAALLVAGALLLAGIRRARGDQGDPAVRRVSRHTVVGMLLLAAGHLAALAGAASELDVPLDTHAHPAPDFVPLDAIASIGAVGYAVVSVFSFSRVRDVWGRLQIVAMAALVLLMAGSVIGR